MRIVYHKLTRGDTFFEYASVHIGEKNSEKWEQMFLFLGTMYAIMKPLSDTANLCGRRERFYLVTKAFAC